MPIYHVWFATKRRRWLLQGDVLDGAREEIASAAARHNLKLIQHECIVDHVHILIEATDRAELSKAMNNIKGVSARRLFQRFPDLKMDAGVDAFWQAGYGQKIVPPGAIPTLCEYVRTQWDRLENYER